MASKLQDLGYFYATSMSQDRKGDGWTFSKIESAKFDDKTI